jgi:hypothetical protein
MGRCTLDWQIFVTDAASRRKTTRNAAQRSTHSTHSQIPVGDKTREAPLPIEDPSPSEVCYLDHCVQFALLHLGC